MMQWARIEDGVVRELTEADPAGRYHPSLVWVEAPAEVRAGWTWDGKTFAAPPPPELRPLRPLPRLVIADRLTDTEVATVATFASGTADQKRWWLRWVSAVEIDPEDAATVAGFVAVFGEERATVLLAPEE